MIWNNLGNQTKGDCAFTERIAIPNKVRNRQTINVAFGFHKGIGKKWKKKERKCKAGKVGPCLVSEKFS